MRKIKELLKNGWIVEMQANLSDSDMWYGVSASHNIWGDVGSWDVAFTIAINNVYKDAKELEKGL